MLRKLVNRWSTLQTAQTNASVQLESALNLDRHCLLFFLDLFITSAWNFILSVWGLYLSVMPVSRFWTKDWVRSYPFLTCKVSAYQLSQESWSLASFFGGNSRKGLSRSTLEYFLEHVLHSLMQGSAGWSWSSEVPVIWYFQRSNISAVSDDPRQLSSACDDCDSWRI